MVIYIYTINNANYLNKYKFNFVFEITENTLYFTIANKINKNEI